MALVINVSLIWSWSHRDMVYTLHNISKENFVCWICCMGCYCQLCLESFSSRTMGIKYTTLWLIFSRVLLIGQTLNKQTRCWKGWLDRAPDTTSLWNVLTLQHVSTYSESGVIGWITLQPVWKSEYSSKYGKPSVQIFPNFTAGLSSAMWSLSGDSCKKPS